MLNNLQEEESEDGIPESEYSEVNYPEVNNPEVNYPEVNYPEVESQNVLTKEDKSAEQNTPEMEVLEEVVTKDGVPEVYNPKADKPQNDHRQDRSSTYDNYPKSEIPKTFDMDYLKTLFEQDKQLEKESLVDEYENFLKYGYINLTAIEYAKMQNSPCSKKPLNPARASKDGRLFYKVECLHTALAGCHDVTNGSRCKKIIQRRGNGFHVVGCECVKRSG